MKDYGMYPIAVIEDRYQGTYTGHKWWALGNAYPARYDHVHDVIHGSDPEIIDQWAALLKANPEDGKHAAFADILAGGATPNEAVAALEAKVT